MLARRPHRIGLGPGWTGGLLLASLLACSGGSSDGGGGPVAPSILVQPQSLVVPPGQSATFSVSAAGTPPLAYQWRKGGLDVPGARSSAYSIPAVTAGDAGSYDVRVSNAAGAATSRAATLTVAASGGLDLSIDGLYLTQSTQTYGGGVPLLKDRDALLRVFVKANRANQAAPQVRVRLYDGAVLLHTYLLDAPGPSVPMQINEAILSSSWNQTIPGATIQPGRSILADVDPDGLIAEGDKGNNQFPLSGTPQPLAVTTVPPWPVTIFPVVQSGLRGNVSALNLAQWTDRLLRMSPVVALDAVLGAPFTSSVALQADGTGWNTLLMELEAKRVAEGNAGARYYYGAVATGYASGVAGLGFVPTSPTSTAGRSAAGWDQSGYPDGGNFPEILAHEVGHNFGRNHAPCSASGPLSDVDPAYPYAGAAIGVYGYDAVQKVLLDKGLTKDVMAYCSPVWISDYTYTGQLAFRRASPLGAALPAGGEGLLVWGLKSEGRWVLQPAFAVRGLPQPAVAPDLLLEARDGFGGLVAAQAVESLVLADGPDPEARGFVAFLSLPAESASRVHALRLWEGGELRAVGWANPGDPTAVLDGAELSRDGARVTLRWPAALHPAVLVRDPATGEILAIGRGGSLNLPFEGSELELTFSDGLHSLRRRLGVGER